MLERRLRKVSLRTLLAVHGLSCNVAQAFHSPLQCRQRHDRPAGEFLGELGMHVERNFIAIAVGIGEVQLCYEFLDAGSEV